MIQRYRLKEVVWEKLLTHYRRCLASLCAMSLHLTFSIERQPIACLFGLLLYWLTIMILLIIIETYSRVVAVAHIVFVFYREL